MQQAQFPIGIDDFGEVITRNYYYVDKTMYIQKLLAFRGKVNLFTRPRRFGKTLNLSMLRYFFEDTGDEQKNKDHRGLFKNLCIAKEEQICQGWMTKYPVVNLTLKSAKQGDFELAYYHLCDAVQAEYRRHDRVLLDSRISPAEKIRYQDILDGTASKAVWYTSLKFLTDILYRTEGKKVIVLIDEYDVPLESAYFRGFYQAMTDLIRSLFESALKTNESLEFAVITGCLRISKESIFTGLNHLETDTVLSERYADCFGFTMPEIQDLAAASGCADKLECIRAWYDGYRFGNVEICNPWSILKYIKDLSGNKNAMPQTYWANTSSNEIVKNLVKNAGTREKDQIEQLIRGGVLEIGICEEITYEDIDAKGELLWNFLFFTGYLTSQTCWMDDQKNIVVQLVIPNLEVKKIYEKTIRNWFQEQLEQQDFHDLYQALEKAEEERVQSVLNEQLQKSISYYDNAESFYHGFLTGVLGQSRIYHVRSNREIGNGRSDLLVYPLDLEKMAFVLELKASARFQDTLLDARKAVDQIQRMRYGDVLVQMGYEQIGVFGIAFYRKNCKVCYGGTYH